MNADQEPANPPPISDSLRERIAGDVSRMVLWGEARENVMRRLEVNGITGAEAEAEYQRAFAERVAVIHGFYRGKARTGILCLVGSGVILWIIFAVFGGFTGKLLGIAFALMGFGLWKFIDGFSGMLMAKKREGSVADLGG